MKLLDGARCYSAGPVEVDTDPVSWRDRIGTILNKNIPHLKIWNPLIKPKWCTQITGADQRADLKAFQSGVFESKSIAKNVEIREICLRLVSACDFIICKLGGKTVGTYEELAHAAAMHKPVLFIGEIDSCWRFAQFSYGMSNPYFKDEQSVCDFLVNVDNGSQKVDNLAWIFLKDKWINHEYTIKSR